MRATDLPDATEPVPRRRVLGLLSWTALGLVGCGAESGPPTAEDAAPSPSPAMTGQTGGPVAPRPSPGRSADGRHEGTGEGDSSGMASSPQPESSLSEPQTSKAESPTREPTPGSTPRPTTEPSGTDGPSTPPLLRTSDVPVGGGVVLGARSLVVTQPAAGTFRGFDIHCTHAGCPVDRVSGGAIRCPCHGSLFSLDTGEPVGGPARRPLDGRTLEVRDGGIYLG